jgi:hypothetical protein
MSIKTSIVCDNCNDTLTGPQVELKGTSEHNFIFLHIDLCYRCWNNLKALLPSRILDLITDPKP